MKLFLTVESFGWELPGKENGQLSSMNSISQWHGECIIHRISFNPHNSFICIFTNEAKDGEAGIFCTSWDPAGSWAGFVLLWLECKYNTCISQDCSFSNYKTYSQGLFKPRRKLNFEVHNLKFKTLEVSCFVHGWHKSFSLSLSSLCLLFSISFPLFSSMHDPHFSEGNPPLQG